MTESNETSLNTYETSESDVSCPICLDSIDQKENNWLITSCGHEFHTSCLMKNAARKHFQCPCCRNLLVESVSDIPDVGDISLEDDIPDLITDYSDDSDRDSTDDYNIQRFSVCSDENYRLDGMRWLFQLANGETADHMDPFSEEFEHWVQEMEQRHSDQENILDGKVDKVMEELDKMKAISNRDIVFTLLQSMHGQFVYSCHALKKTHNVRRSIDSIIRRFEI